MTLLMLFAVVAGAATALTPCVLPVLPALLSASATGGRRRPIGIVFGLAVTYTITIAALASVIDGVGLAEGAVRTIAIAVLFIFGLTLLVPRIGDRIEVKLSPLSRLGPRSRGDGIWSGLAVGAALGFLYAPCAGPILAAVISLSATGGSSGRVLALAVSYSVGSAAVLLLLAFGGRRLAARIRRAGQGLTLQRALGTVMIATAVLMLADLDVRFQTALANHFPDFLTNPTRPLERSSAVENRLADLRGRPRFDSASARRPVNVDNSGRRTAETKSLPVLGKAPEFRETQRWFNTGGRSLSMRALRGRVVLIDFWTYTCINCIRTLPALKAWDDRYRERGLTIVGVHTPEFVFERDAGNVESATRQNGLHYPVVQDNRYGTWEAWGNQYWPAKYLVDSRGRVRYTHFGEGEYDKTESAIRSLLAEAGHGALGRMTHAAPEAPSSGIETPETYLGYARAEGFVPNGVRRGISRYPGAEDLPPNSFALKGVWSVGAEAASALRSPSIDVQFGARKVFLVLSSDRQRPRHVRVLLDGRQIAAADAGDDVRRGRVVVRRQRLYSLVSLPRVERRRLTLEFDPGVSGYAFTFG